MIRISHPQRPTIIPLILHRHSTPIPLSISKQRRRIKPLVINHRTTIPSTAIMLIVRASQRTHGAHSPSPATDAATDTAAGYATEEHRVPHAILASGVDA